MSDENFPIPRLFLAATLTLYRWYGYNFGSTIPPKDLEKLSAVVNTVWITCSKGLLFKEERLLVSKSFKPSVLLRSYGVHGTKNKNIVFLIHLRFRIDELYFWFQNSKLQLPTTYVSILNNVLNDWRTIVHTVMSVWEWRFFIYVICGMPHQSSWFTFDFIHLYICWWCGRLYRYIINDMDDISS